MFRQGLTKMVDGKDLMVTKSVQAAIIDVNERGTMASVATSKVLFCLTLPTTYCF